MDMSVITINSDSKIPIENHFRVSAGPGAGKTHWLVNHIHNVLNNSNRFGKTRKIACITYTNIAVETILQRLGLATNHVEVSTIHSFLYKQIVKPYVSNIAAMYNLSAKDIDGHDDTVLSNYSFLKELKENTAQNYLRTDGELIKAISSAQWKFDKQNRLVFKPDYPHKIDGYSVKNTTYDEYKRLAWGKGVLHHDDILFFSYQLVAKFPFILQVINAKFPYFFIDEFQDTNPIQTHLLSLIGQKETIVGVIGDKSQSIYGFQGAEPAQFSSFALPNLINYQMLENRRSTNQIVGFLNTIRKNIVQNPLRNQNGSNPTIVITSPVVALRKVKELCGNALVYSLSRDNITSNIMKRESDTGIPTENLLQIFNEVDSNNKRKRLVTSCIKATELARQKRFKEAIKELSRLFRDENGNKNPKDALKTINILLQFYDNFKDNLLIDMLAIVNDKIKKVAGLKAGNIQTFYQTYRYSQLAVCVKITEDDSCHRTIHKAKSAEFDNVLLLLKDEKDLEFISKPNFENNEEHRINYVAVSRARENLYISVPILSDTNRKIFEPLFNIIEI